MTVVVFDGALGVHYGFGFLSSRDGDTPDLDEARSGQSNGLLGAGVPGKLAMIFGLHTGPEPLRIEWTDAEPSIDDSWEEVVEASVDLPSTEMLLSAFEEFIDVVVPASGLHRARFCAVGMDAAHELDSRDEDEDAPDRYLLQLWPASARPDSIERQTGSYAAYWHGEARGESHPVSPEQQDLAELAFVFSSATPAAQQEALIFILERVIAVTGLSNEPAAARVGERIRGGEVIQRYPDDLQDLAVRLDSEAPPVPRTGQMDLHNMGWRRLQAGAALTGALNQPVAEAMSGEYGPVYHARWALDEHWLETRTRAIEILSAR